MLKKQYSGTETAERVPYWTGIAILAYRMKKLGKGVIRFTDANHVLLRIHDILVWIRIRMRIRGSMPLTN